MKQSSKKQSTGKETPAKSKLGVPGQPISTPPETKSGLLELFIDGIKTMYWAENHLVKSLPKMADAAGATELKAAITDHWEVTKGHASRLEGVLEMLGIKIQAKKCDACEGLVMSGEQIIENTVAGSEARDTGIIMAALKVENYEMTSYNGLIQLAATLRQTEAAESLRQNLAEEMESEQLLMAMSQQTPPDKQDKL